MEQEIVLSPSLINKFLKIKRNEQEVVGGEENRGIIILKVLQKLNIDVVTAIGTNSDNLGSE